MGEWIYKLLGTEERINLVITGLSSLKCEPKLFSDTGEPVDVQNRKPYLIQMSVRGRRHKKIAEQLIKEKYGIDIVGKPLRNNSSPFIEKLISYLLKRIPEGAALYVGTLGSVGAFYDAIVKEIPAEIHGASVPFPYLTFFVGSLIPMGVYMITGIKELFKKDTDEPPSSTPV